MATDCVNADVREFAEAHEKVGKLATAPAGSPKKDIETRPQRNVLDKSVAVEVVGHKVAGDNAPR